MRVAEVMSVFPVTVDVAIPAHEALATAELHGIHHMLAIDGRELAGVVCRCDLSAARASDAVARCASAPVTTVLASASVELAARSFTTLGIGCLPVVDDDGALLGIVTRRDLRRAGALPDTPGVDRCAQCGTSHHLRPPRCPDEPVVCFHCDSEQRHQPSSGVRPVSGIREVA